MKTKTVIELDKEEKELFVVIMDCAIRYIKSAPQKTFNAGDYLCLTKEEMIAFANQLDNSL